EIRRKSATTSPRPLLQRSRALSSAEIRRTMTPEITKDQLQRSRALSSAEMPQSGLWRRPQRPASTEPRSFERGDVLGRSEEIVSCLGFNGAALFRARRCHAAELVKDSAAASTEPRSFERGDPV